MTTAEVDAWMSRYSNPTRDVVQRVRHMLLAVDDRITETIKWDTPTFVYKGNIASFYPHTKDHVTLVFHRGARIPGHYPHLEPEKEDRAIMRISSFQEAEELRPEIEALVKAWILLRGDADDAAAIAPAS